MLGDKTSTSIFVVNCFREIHKMKYVNFINGYSICDINRYKYTVKTY
nr:ankyrin repeat containing protein [Oriental turtle dovepox virus]